MKTTGWLVAAAGIIALSFAVPAQAAPLSQGLGLTTESANNEGVQPVHYRRYRHYRHHRHYRRHYGYYGYGPGIYLNFGPRRHHHHHRYHRRHWR